MSFGITVIRTIGDAQVTITALAEGVTDTLRIATHLATGTDQAQDAKPLKATTAKNEKADPAAKSNQEEQTRTASDSSASSSSASNAASANAKNDEPQTLDYEKDIKPLVLGIAKISRDKAEALLKRFGVSSAKNLKPEQFVDFKETADKVIAGTYDPIASDEGALA